MAQPIVYLDTSEVKPGRLEELKAAMADLARFVKANEPHCSPTTCSSVRTEAE